ncbi:MAG TPA: pyridoxal phosphate-dependent aminotransferase [Polyangiaceae bacterium]|jgi:aspartate aminotransferase|nr:pyridoxal phosphate-dependent aminotransferase [Polyangiaceae bacterium]
MVDENTISRWAVAGALDAKDSATRKMFELGLRLRRESDAPVYDLSLGNPHLEPPSIWRDAIVTMLQTEPPGQHRYMPNAGFGYVRAFIAEREAARFGVPFIEADVIMTVGAAGAMAIALRSIVDPDEEILAPSPFFPDYEHYARAVGAKLVLAPTRADFSLDVPALERAIGDRTRVVVVNSPNNPTGAIYTDGELAELGRMLARVSAARARPLYVLEDSPYRDIVFDGSKPASILAHYDHVIHISSHSKDLGLAGERIGFAAISPRAPGRALLQRVLPFANRVLGFVSAPALMQRSLPLVLGKPGGRVDTGAYERNARAFYEPLAALGFAVTPARGGLFLFPQVPAPWVDAFGDAAGEALAQRLAERRTLVVPGGTFGSPHHIRIALCVPSTDVEGALAAFRDVAARPKGP